MKNIKENELIYEAYVNADKEDKTLLQEREHRNPEEEIVWSDRDYEVKKLQSVRSLLKYSNNTGWGTKVARMARAYLAKGPLYVIIKNGQLPPEALVQFGYGRNNINAFDPYNHEITDPMLLDIIQQIPQE